MRARATTTVALLVALLQVVMSGPEAADAVTTPTVQTVSSVTLQTGEGILRLTGQDARDAITYDGQHLLVRTESMLDGANVSLYRVDGAPLAPAEGSTYDNGDPTTGYMIMSVLGHSADGHYTIHHATASEIWVTFDVRVGVGGHVVGEVRSGVPSQVPQASVAPAVVSWPRVPPGRISEPETVRYTNLLGRPVTPMLPEVVAGASRFQVSGQTCDGTVLQAGESCEVQVAFAPQQAGYHTGTLTFQEQGGDALASVTLRGYGAPGVSTWSIDSPASAGMGGLRAELDTSTHDFVGQGSPWDWTFEARPAPGSSASGPGGEIRIHSHPDRPLAPGSYGVADSTRLYVSELGLDCVLDQSKTVLDVDEAVYDPVADALIAADLVAKVTCEGKSVPTTFALKWRADQEAVTPPPVLGDTDPPAAPTGVTDTVTSDRRVLLGWDPAADLDFADHVVVVKPGTSAPTGPADGTVVRRLRGMSVGSTIDVTDEATAGPHTFAVFARDLSGLASAGTSLFVPDVVPPRHVGYAYVAVVPPYSVVVSWAMSDSEDLDHQVVELLDAADPSHVLATRDVGLGWTAKFGNGESDPWPGVRSVIARVRSVDSTGNESVVMSTRTIATYGDLRLPHPRRCGTPFQLRYDLGSEFGLTDAPAASASLLASRVGTSAYAVVERRNVWSQTPNYFTVAPCTNTRYRVEYVGASPYHWSSTGLLVTVASAPSLVASAETARRGTRVTLTATSRPRRAGVVMRLQRRTTTGWHTVDEGATGARGRYAFAIRPSVRGRLTYRVVAPASSLNSRGESNGLMVKVT